MTFYKFAFVSCAIVACSVSWGQSLPYPTKPVRFITASVNSPQDLIGRIVGQKLSENWGQPVLVENRAGSGALISITTVAKAPPDGYTVLVSSSGYAVNPSLYKDAQYDAENDLVPVIIAASSPNIIVAHPGYAATMKDIVARAKDGKLNYGSPGAGTTPHLTAEYLFKTIAGVSATHIPYKGIPPLIAASYSGEVPVATMGLSGAVPGVKAGKLRGIAVTSSRRSSVLPDVPTIAEAGFPGIEDSTWVVFMLPAAAPAGLVSRLRADIEKVMAAPDVRERVATLGFEPVNSSPQETAAFIRTELAKWARIVKATGATAE